MYCMGGNLQSHSLNVIKNPRKFTWGGAFWLVKECLIWRKYKYEEKGKLTKKRIFFSSAFPFDLIKHEIWDDRAPIKAEWSGKLFISAYKIKSLYPGQISILMNGAIRGNGNGRE